MEFKVLGPLEVWRDGQPIEVRGSKRRALLALLILHANEVVRSDRLVDELWGERSPGNASAALQNHISRLRKDLGGDILVTKPWGYVIRADPQSIDLQRFEVLLAESRTLPASQRRERMQEALALWRGPALADVASESALTTEVARLEELRLSALEQRIDADLELGGGDAELVAELEALVAKHPLRERLRGQLILALYRGGRQAEALEAYRETRRLLVEELGIEPSRELRELEQAILRQDPALGVAPARHAPPAPDDDRRFRWPRSPLVVALAALLLAGGGLAAAVVLTAGGPEPTSAAPAASHASSAIRQQPTTSTAARTLEEQPSASTAARTGERPPTASTAALRPKRQPSAPPATTSVHRPSAETARQPLPPPPPPPARRPPAVTTAPMTTTEAKPPTTKPAPTKKEPFTIADDFSRPIFDPAIWHIVGRDFGGVFDQSNGRLEIMLLADAQPDPAWNQVGGHYGTRCQFTGDFDASVEFELLTWPSGAGAYAGLSAYFANSAVVRQSSAQWGEQYASWISGAHGAIPLDDRQGKLRLRRVAATITTYIWYAGAWRTVVSGRSAGRATLGLQLQADGDQFSHTDVRVAFDNFVVSATEADCPPGSDPR